MLTFGREGQKGAHKGATRYNLRVLVIDQILNGRDIPIGHAPLLPSYESATILPYEQGYLSDAGRSWGYGMRMSGREYLFDVMDIEHKE